MNFPQPKQSLFLRGLAQVRVFLGFASARDFAAQVGLHHTVLSMIENQRRPAGSKIVKRLEDFLGCDSVDLVEEASEERLLELRLRFLRRQMQQDKAALAGLKTKTPA